MRLLTVAVITALITSSLVSGMASAASINLYSARKEALIKPMLDQFTAATGIKVRLLTGSGDALLARLASEGANTPADLFLTVDAGNLHRAAQAGIFQPLGSTLAHAAVPQYLQDNNGLWVGLSVRARPIFYAIDRVDPSQLSGYADLASSSWKGNVCIRSSDNIYNQSLVGALLAHWGEAATESWARGLVNNFAKPPVGGDRDQILAVANGMCDIAVANTYYYGLMQASEDAAVRAAAAKVAIFWPDQATNGSHINVSGIGLTRYGKHPDEARQLVEFLLSAEAQAWYAASNNEYPARNDVNWSERLQNWGSFKPDQLPMTVLGENNAAAVRLMNRAGWR
jgi:iron(III) transport system substrate-binding protein